LNTTPTCMLCEAANVTGREEAATRKLALSEVMALIVALPVPVLVMVTAWLEEADPTVSLPKLMDEGPTEICADPEEELPPVPVSMMLLGEYGELL
jgi:hypothetical protein